MTSAIALASSFKGEAAFPATTTTPLDVRLLSAYSYCQQPGDTDYHTRSAAFTLSPYHHPSLFITISHSMDGLTRLASCASTMKAIMSFLVKYPLPWVSYMENNTGRKEGRQKGSGSA